MSDYRDMYDRDYLYAFDLKGRDSVQTIVEVKAGSLRGSDGKTTRKPILYFSDKKDRRGLVLCKTSARVIASMYGTDVANWVGKRITLFAMRVMSFGEMVEAIRIRPSIPKANAPAGEFAEPRAEQAGE